MDSKQRCETCKHFEEKAGPSGRHECTRDELEIEDYDGHYFPFQPPSPDFGCNLWEGDSPQIAEADSELLERLSAAVHADWMAEQAARGRTSSVGRDGEEYMVPYDQLSEAAKELDRVTVRAVLKHLPPAPPPLLEPYDWGPEGVPQGEPISHDGKGWKVGE